MKDQDHTEAKTQAPLARWTKEAAGSRAFGTALRARNLRSSRVSNG